MAAALTTISKKAEIDVPILLIGIAFGLGALACIVTANFETITKRSRYRPIKLMFPPEDRMPYNSNIMAMMDGESAASRSFRSTRSMGRNEI
jgi:hypothetical protein